MFVDIQITLLLLNIICSRVQYIFLSIPRGKIYSHLASRNIWYIRSRLCVYTCVHLYVSFLVLCLYMYIYFACASPHLHFLPFFISIFSFCFVNRFQYKLPNPSLCVSKYLRLLFTHNNKTEVTSIFSYIQSTGVIFSSLESVSFCINS